MEEIKYEDVKRAGGTDQDVLGKVVGLAVDVALNLVKAAGFTVRVVQPDQLVTADFVATRANLYVENNVVSKANLG